MNMIKPITQINSNSYDVYNKSKASNSDNMNADLNFSHDSSEQAKDQYIKTPTTEDSTKELYHSLKPSITLSNSFNPNDISLGITFADKNSNILPTINNVNSKNENVATSDTSTKIHTNLDGTRFLVVQTVVGEQTFEKSIKLNETL